MCLTRVLALGVVVSVATAAHASYELLLAVDQFNSVVHRIDPVLGISLGSFGQGFMNGPSQCVVDTATGIAYVSNYNIATIQKWDYSTGAFLGDFQTGVNGLWGLKRLNNGNLIGADGQFVRVYSTGGTLLNSFPTTSGFGVGTDGTNIYVADGNNIRKLSQTGNSLGLMATPSRNVYDIQIRNGVAYTAGFNYSNRFGRFNIGTMSGYTESTNNLFTNQDTETLAFSHGSYLYMEGNTTAAGNAQVINRFNLTPNTPFSNFGIFPANARITGMTTILAPEPGALGALALGLFMITRRRRL